MLTPTSIQSSRAILQQRLNQFQSLWRDDEAARAGIASNPDWSDSYRAQKVAELPNVGGKLAALASEMKAAADELDAARGIWSDARLVLQIQADASMDAARIPMATLWLSQAHAMDPATRQAAAESAILQRDWARLHAVTLGHIDAHGRALTTGDFRGVELDTLPIQSRIEVLNDLDIAKALQLRAEQAVHVWQNQGAENYTLTHRIAKAEEHLPVAVKAREAALKLTPAESLIQNRAATKAAGLESDLPADFIPDDRESNIG